MAEIETFSRRWVTPPMSRFSTVTAAVIIACGAAMASIGPAAARSAASPTGSITVEPVNLKATNDFGSYLKGGQHGSVRVSGAVSPTTSGQVVALYAQPLPAPAANAGSAEPRIALAREAASPMAGGRDDYFNSDSCTSVMFCMAVGGYTLGGHTPGLSEMLSEGNWVTERTQPITRRQYLRQ